MQRSRHLGNNADKQWETERRDARRAAVRLNHGLNEIEEAQLYHVNNMTKEQKRLQMDLVKMKQATAKNKTTKCVPPGKSPLYPPNSGGRGKLSRHDKNESKNTVSTPEGIVVASGSSMTLQMRINDFMDGVSRKDNLQSSPSVQGPTAEPPESDINVTDVENAMAKRLSISGSINEVQNSSEFNDKTKGLTIKSSTQETIPKSAYFNAPPSKSRRGSLFKEKYIFDEETFAPDGGLRTLHTMPDLMVSLKEAKKARYIRHRHKLDSEKELSVHEVFQKDHNKDNDTNKN
ncbi:coiled-coil domain-containing protein 190-like [Spea bombifrons]|uniref:coiled-coil domain-containing protein 190-like n=1 Tax=Spea bombifrons TaxID=233779 RepID=UPI00234BCC65|nr:coiled-coil domain-containing protein 190-like [Spea bombifrons]XP_053325281.1 coiled-coil domain-containing protein 190-like [Spea bombifrons]